MIQGITNMLKTSYFKGIQKKNHTSQSFRKYFPPHFQKFSNLSQHVSSSHPVQNKYQDQQDILISQKNFRRNKHLINSYQDISEICSLITSQQRCQNWIVLIQNSKNNYIVQQKLYHSIIQGTVKVHNLFLMLIQCRVLPNDIWLPIEALCKLQGDRQNQLCCLIHFTITNMGTKYQEINNPRKWSKQKALKQMGPNFEMIYGNGENSLQQKISILPMLIALNNKNNSVLWQRLQWLYNFPRAVISDLRNNMRELLQEKLSVTVSQEITDYFKSKMCLKSIQLLEVEGFVSGKNLFSYAYQLYSISMILNLLANYECDRETLSFQSEQRESVFRSEIIGFLLELFTCIEIYQYDFESTLNINCKDCDMANIKQIIIKNKLYMQQLKGTEFNQELHAILKHKMKIQNSQKQKNNMKQDLQDQTMEIDRLSTIQQATKNFQSWLSSNTDPKNTCQNLTLQSTSAAIAQFIPRFNSEEWFNQKRHSILFTPSFYYEHNISRSDTQHCLQEFIITTTPQQTLQLFIAQRQQTIINHLLFQLFHLKTDYLQIIYAILTDCYYNYSNNIWGVAIQEAWSQNSSNFLRLQLYLVKNFVLDFLIGWFSSIQTKNNPIIMICYYGIIGFLIKSNPIAYGKIDRIVSNIEQQMSNPTESSRRKKNITGSSSKKSLNQKKEIHLNPHLNQIEYLAKSFLDNFSLCKSTIFFILADQFEWKQNQICQYENKFYTSLFVKRIIEDNRIQWMAVLIQSIVSFFLAQNNKKHLHLPIGEDNENQKYQLVTFLLTLYYYYEETMENSFQQKLFSLKNSPLSHEKIDVPNSKFFDKLIEKQKFMEILYPLKVRILHSFLTPISPKHSQIPKQERMLIFFTEILDRWQQFFNNPKNSKKSILQYNLNYCLLRVYKKKLKNRICGFVKTKQYEQNGEQYYFNLVKGCLKSSLS